MRGLWLLCTYPLLRQRPLRVPPLRRVTLKAQSNQTLFAPTPRCLAVARCGSACPHHRPSSVGTPRSAIPGRVAANPASCRVTHCATPAFGQRGLTGPLRSRSKTRSRSKDREADDRYAAPLLRGFFSPGKNPDSPKAIQKQIEDSILCLILIFVSLIKFSMPMNTCKAGEPHVRTACRNRR